MKQLLLLGLLFGLCCAPLRAQRLRQTEWESGRQEKGEKVGVWEYYGYTRDGRQLVVQKYDHSAKKCCISAP